MGGGGMPKLKENIDPDLTTQKEFQSSAKQRKLLYEFKQFKLHTFWTGKSKTSDETFRKNIIMGNQLIPKPCHNQRQSTETSESQYLLV